MGKTWRFHRLSCFRYVGEILGFVGAVLDHPRGAGYGISEIQRAKANPDTRPASKFHIHHSPPEIYMKVRGEPCLSLPCPKLPCYFKWSILGSVIDTSLGESICSKMSSPFQAQGWAWAGRLHQKTGTLWNSSDNMWTLPLIKCK